jgi:hypothetical protein
MSFYKKWLLPILSIFTFFLTSCQNNQQATGIEIKGDTIIETSRFFIEKTVRPRPIIKGGIGLTFDTTPEDVEAIGFLSLEKNGKFIGKWMKFRKSKNEFWSSKKITFSPIKKTVKRLEANKYYYKDESYMGTTTESRCNDDFSILRNTLKDKYPLLKNTTPNKYIHMLAVKVKGYKGLKLSEGKHETIQRLHFDKPSNLIVGLGKTISLECWPSNNESYRLNISYATEYDSKNNEHEVYRKQNQNKYLKSININIDEL